MQCLLPAYGQQDPLYLQYNFNLQTINPAYAGSWETPGFQLLGRHQWWGIEGAPRTYTFTFQTPTSGDNVALGFNLVSDQTGLEQRITLTLDYSYRLRINDHSFLRLGMKAGGSAYMNSLSSYRGYPGDPPDPLFIGSLDENFLPNFGFGTFYYGERFYLGLAVPRTVKTSHKISYNNYFYASFDYDPLLYLHGGFVFNWGSYVRFKPTFLAVAAKGVQPEVNLSANFLLNEKVWLGANYQVHDSYGFILQWVFDKRLRLGYAMEFSLNELADYHDGTHEILVSYELGILRRIWSSPRYF